MCGYKNFFFLFLLHSLLISISRLLYAGVTVTTCASALAWVCKCGCASGRCACIESMGVHWGYENISLSLDFNIASCDCTYDTSSAKWWQSNWNRECHPVSLKRRAESPTGELEQPWFLPASGLLNCYCLQSCHVNNNWTVGHLYNLRTKLKRCYAFLVFKMSLQ